MVALPAATPILASAGDTGHEHASTWAEFEADNVDCLAPAELALIQSVIEAGGTYVGGGGAEGWWTLRPAPTSNTVDKLAQAQSDLHTLADAIPDASHRIELMRVHAELGDAVYDLMTTEAA